ARLARQPECPFETIPLHPQRRLPFRAGHEIKCRADADEHRRMDPADMVRHPPLLLRRSQSDPDDVRARCTDLVEDCLVLQAPCGAITRARRAAYLDAGYFSGERAFQLLRDALAAAIEIVAISACNPVMAKVSKQIRPIDSGDTGMPKKPAEPDQRHAVRRHKPGIVENPTKARILVPFHN